MTDCKRRALEFVLLVGAMSFFAVRLAPAIVHVRGLGAWWVSGRREQVPHL